MTDYQWTPTGYRAELMAPGQPDLSSVPLKDYDRLFVAPDPRGVRELAPSPTRRLTYVLEAPGAFRMPDARGMPVLVSPGVTATLGHADVEASGGELDLTACMGTLSGGHGVIRNSMLTVRGGTWEVLDDPTGPPSRLDVREDAHVTARAGRGRVELGGGQATLELGGQWQVTLRQDQASLRGGLVTLRNRASGVFDLGQGIPTHRLALALADDATARVVLRGLSNESEAQVRAAGRATLGVDARDAKNHVSVDARDDARIDAGSQCVVRASGRAQVVARGSCKVYLSDQATIEENGDDVVLRDQRAARAAS